MPIKKSEILNSLRLKRDNKEFAKVRAEMIIASKIIHGLKDANISEDEFCSLMNITDGTLSKWLSGTYNYPMRTLVEIQYHLGIGLLNLEMKK